MNATIAVPVDGDEIFSHFGKATKFKIYAIAEDVVTSSTVEDTGGAAHEDLALWLVMRNVNAVLCDSIGPGAMGALMAAGIVPLAGVKGGADTAVKQLIDGTLEALHEATCAHHHGGGCGGHCGGHCGHGGCCH